MDVKEDIRQTPEYREIGNSFGDPLVLAPRFYVTSVRLPSGERVDPRNVELPSAFVLDDDKKTIVNQYECYAPTEN